MSDVNGQGEHDRAVATDAKLDQLSESVDRRFEQVDRRFEQVDQRFEQIDRRFDEVDRRFDRVEQRLDRVEIAVEGLRDGVAQLAEAHAAMHATMNRRFDEVVELMNQRVVPLEMAVHYHSKVLGHHNLTAGSNDL